MPISLLIIDSQPLVRLGLRAAATDHDVVVVGETSNGTNGLALFCETRPDVTVIGLRLIDFCAAEDLRLFFDRQPDAKIIVLAGDAGDAEIKSSLDQGASGFVTDRIPPEEMIKAIKTVASGGYFVPKAVADTLSSGIAVEALTVAETAVLRMLAGGMSNKEIAFALDVTDNTIKTHVRHIFGKLGVTDRTTATVTAIKRGLVRIDT